jgi:NitT/TauT family transport system ATP-binding protein
LVIGPSGCGKSTLFNVIGGLLSHHQGVVTVAGETISETHKSIGMVFQEESTFPWRNVVDNVAFPLELAHRHAARQTHRARALFHPAGRTRRAREPLAIGTNARIGRLGGLERIKRT